MRVIRVFTPEPLRAPGRTVLEGTAAAHVARVLRLRGGDQLTLFNGDGWEYGGVVTAIRSQRVEVEIAVRTRGQPESPLSVTLVQGVARGERMDLVIQKATELGVARIVPVLAGRSVVRIDPRQVERKRAHWQAVAIAACEQSGRSTLPGVELPMPLDAWLAVPPGDGPRLLLLPGAPLPLGSLTPGTAAATVLIGPEGGLTDAEQGTATAAGYEPRSLGPRILRTETAAIVALAVLQSSAGDLH